MPRLFVVLPPPGPQRTLTLIAAASAVSTGIYLSTVVYFTRFVGISPMRVGVGLSVAGATCILGGVLVGKLSDRRDPLIVLRGSLIVASAATLGFLMVKGFAMYLLVVPAAAAGQACVQLLTTAIIPRVVTSRANEFRAYTRSVLNVGIAVGIGLSALAVQFDSALLYRTAIAVGASFLVLAALLVGWLRPLAVAAIEPADARHRWTALRDRPYLALTVLGGVLSLQFRIQSVAIPLWIIGATTAPRWSIAAFDMLNIAIVVLFQVRASRRVVDVSAAGAALRRSGWAFLVACVLFAFAGGHGGWVAVLILLAGGAILSVGELWQASGGVEASNLLAPPQEIGYYLGVFSIGTGIADAVGPALLAWLCVGIGVIGWHITGLALLAAGLLSPFVVAWAESTRDRYGSLPRHEAGREFPVPAQKEPISMEATIDIQIPEADFTEPLRTDDLTGVARPPKMVAAQMVPVTPSTRILAEASNPARDLLMPGLASAAGAPVRGAGRARIGRRRTLGRSVRRR